MARRRDANELVRRYRFSSWWNLAGYYEICIGEDGTIILKSLLRKTRIKVNDISAIRWATRSTGMPEGGREDHRVVLIEHNQGHIELIGFDEAYDFAKNLQRLNPSIQVDAGL